MKREDKCFNVGRKGGSGGGVTSFNGRTGAVTPAEGDYAAFYLELDGTNSPTADIDWGGFSITNLTALFDTNNVVSVKVDARVLNTPDGGIIFDWSTNDKIGILSTHTNLTLTNYASNAAAIVGGLVAGDLYRTAGVVMIVI